MESVRQTTCFDVFLCRKANVLCVPGLLRRSDNLLITGV